MTKFDDTFNRFLADIESLLDDQIPAQEPANLYQPVKYILSGKGKRIRPVLAMISCGAVGGNPAIAVHAGAAIEILHNFTLVHDDIMDKSPLRRGRQTIHLKWDEPTAILAGDVMVGFAYKLLDSYSSHPNCPQIFRTLTSGLIEVCEGQVFDMMNNTKTDATGDDYLMTITKKTAKILETSCLIGAYAGMAKPDQLKALSDYAINLGIAFQMQDDILDLMADEAELGKHIGQDIIEGKKTWLMIEARNRAESDTQKNLIAKFFSNNGLSEDEIETVRAFLVQSGIIDDAETLAESYFAKAKQSLAVLSDSHYKDMLIWLADKISKRKN